MVFLAEHHLALGCVEFHALHGGDQLFRIGAACFLDGGHDGNTG